MTYDSSDLYDFGAVLARSRSRARQLIAERGALQMKADDGYMALFNSGGTYREVTYGYGYPTRSKLSGKVVGVALSAEKLRRHEEKFAGREKRQRRTTVGLKAAVLELHRRGTIPAAIADALNVSDRRVRQILAAAA